MTPAACILGHSDVVLWGLDSRTRILRQLAACGIDRLLDDAAAATEADTVLLIDARYLFEVRTFVALLARPGTLLISPQDGRIAAAYAPRAELADYRACMTDGDGVLPASARRLTPDALEAYDRQLRKSAPPLLEPLTQERRPALESLLYGNAYKGVTDLVTKWWWPRPARRIVGWCANAHITPNMVTLTGLALVVLATLLFAQGHYLAGLACGWVMTLLDTVDGKLARVTVLSSPLGHWLDHGMDIVHPPIWYVFWGLGLGLDAVAGMPLATLHWAVVGGYVGGRLVEALFHALGHCGLFAWRPFDAYFRLVTARRNPCLLILTPATLLGRPDLGLLGVAAWTVFTTVVLVVRLVQASIVRLGGPPLDSWLKAPDAATRHARAYATFAGTRSAYE
ncbi:MAG: CDP-alcohol phosphatidyltransferase family protein [Gammaproteobacteria bacterium]